MRHSGIKELSMQDQNHEGKTTLIAVAQEKEEACRQQRAVDGRYC